QIQSEGRWSVVEEHVGVRCGQVHRGRVRAGAGRQGKDEGDLSPQAGAHDQPGRVHEASGRTDHHQHGLGRPEETRGRRLTVQFEPMRPVNVSRKPKKHMPMPTRKAAKATNVTNGNEYAVKAAPTSASRIPAALVSTRSP